MRGRFTLYFLGVSSAGFALIMLFFAIYAALLGESFAGFAVTSALALPLGIILLRAGHKEAEPSRREAIAGVLLLWLLVPLLGAIPFAVSGGFSPLDALFESMSGFTTTGATVLQDFETFPLSLFMWRALTQWLGGVGIIVLFIAVLPQLALAGRQMFFAEVPGPTEERLTPRLRSTANAVLFVYLSLTVVAAVSYFLAGLPLFDALANALTTPASGGFSPNSRNFGGYQNPTFEWLAVVFMALAGINFALLYRALMGRPLELWRDAEFKTYLAIALIAASLLILFLRHTYEPLETLRHGFFQAFSIITTSGFTSVDFARWPLEAQVTIVLLMFVGGSAGSATGGIKVARWLIIGKHTFREVQRTLYPRAVLPVRVGRRVVSEEVLRAVASFITLYAALCAATSFILVWFGADLITAFTAALACVGNIGPGFGAVEPALTYAELHPVSRGVLIFAMYAGRLEIVAVFLVFKRDFWRLPRVNLFGWA